MNFLKERDPASLERLEKKVKLQFLFSQTRPSQSPQASKQATPINMDSEQIIRFAARARRASLSACIPQFIAANFLPPQAQPWLGWQQVPHSNATAPQTCA